MCKKITSYPLVILLKYYFLKRKSDSKHLVRIALPPPSVSVFARDLNNCYLSRTLATSYSSHKVNSKIVTKMRLCSLSDTCQWSVCTQLKTQNMLIVGSLTTPELAVELIYLSPAETWHVRFPWYSCTMIWICIERGFGDTRFRYAKNLIILFSVHQLACTAGVMPLWLYYQMTHLTNTS